MKFIAKVFALCIISDLCSVCKTEFLSSLLTCFCANDISSKRSNTIASIKFFRVLVASKCKRILFERVHCKILNIISIKFCRFCTGRVLSN